MSVVIDTSYFISYIASPFEDKFTWIANEELITTTLFAYEFHNVLLNSLKIDKADLCKYHNVLDKLNMTYLCIKDYESSIYEIACDHGLSFYDASFLWLAIHTKSQIATHDNAVIRSANMINVKAIY